MSGLIECFGMVERWDRGIDERAAISGEIKRVYVGPGISYWWLDTDFTPQVRYVENAANNPAVRLQFRCIEPPAGVSVAVLGFGRYEILRTKSAATIETAKTLGEL